MKKTITLIFLSLLLCGCTAEYNATITNTTFKENININVPFEDASEEQMDVYSDQQIPVTLNADEDMFYNLKTTTSSDSYILKLDHEFALKEISGGYFIRNCYNEVKINENENMISLKTGNVFTCIVGTDGLAVDKVIVNIKTQLKVQNHNADKVNNNVYTWEIDKTNYNNHPIEMMLNKSSTLERIADQMSFNVFNKTIVLICMSIIIVALVIYFFFKNQQNKKNDF